MKKFAWAALIALPLLAFIQQKASAGDGCCWAHEFCRFKIKICAQVWPCPRCGHGYGGCGSGYGYGGYGYGSGSDVCGPCFNECAGVVPGPWYTYWPYGGAPVMTSPFNFWSWNYDDNFRLTSGAAPFPYWGPAH
jgi:hypothetical protein